jgi:hypothetical protein
MPDWTCDLDHPYRSAQTERCGTYRPVSNLVRAEALTGRVCFRDSYFAP